MDALEFNVQIDHQGLLTNCNKDCIMSSLTKTNSIMYLCYAPFGK